MTILDINEQIELKEKQLTEHNNTNIDWKPCRIENYTVPSFIIPETRKKNSQRVLLSKVLAFIDSVKHIRYTDACTVMPVSCKSKRLISICGNFKEVSRLISFMCCVGLLEVEDNNYQYNADNSAYNKCKTYRYYIENEENIKAYCDTHNINTYIVSNTYDTVADIFAIESFDASKVLFNSKLHLLKPSNFSVSDFESYLIGCLYANYPLLRKYQELADQINRTYYRDYPELSLRFIPSFTWSKGNKAVRKIGIRCTNSLVSAKKDNTTDSEYRLYKKDVLDTYKLNLSKDVKSSVPRITASINAGEWVAEDIDIYEKIYDIYIAYKNDNQYIDTVADTFAEYREAVKSMHMRGYFDDESTIGVHTRRCMANVLDKEAVDHEMKLFKRAITDAEGGHLFDNEIFFHESCIYMDVLKELLDSGFFVWQCYDAFYGRKEGVTQEQFEQLVQEIVKRKAIEYIGFCF